MKILVSGAAGFIGANLGKSLIASGHDCVFIDRVSPYYSTDLKKVRFKELTKSKLLEIDTRDSALREIFRSERFDCVIHLAAQPGVRISYPESLNYFSDNIEGFISIAQMACEFEVPKFLYASSSSVYEKAKIFPFSERETLSKPDGIYPYTKWLDEEIACELSRISATKFLGLRFFSVYGPWGRPDMAYFRMIGAIFDKATFTLNGNGEIKRDFTFIDDVTDRITKLLENQDALPPVLNIGGGRAMSIKDLHSIIEMETGRKLNVRFAESSALDLPITLADGTLLNSIIGDFPYTPIEEGLRRTIDWFEDSIRKYEVDVWFQ
jgi:UDP-glucuronate 4-epimerase